MVSNRTKPAVIHTVPKGISPGRLGRLVRKEAEGPRRMGGLFPLQSSQMGVEVQIVPLRRLGKRLPGHPVSLGVQRVDLSRRSVQADGQIAALVHLHPGPFSEADQHLPKNLIHRFHLLASSHPHLHRHRQRCALPVQIRPQGGLSRGGLSQLGPHHRQVRFLHQGLSDILEGQGLPGGGLFPAQLVQAAAQLRQEGETVRAGRSAGRAPAEGGPPPPPAAEIPAPLGT